MTELTDQPADYYSGASDEDNTLIDAIDRLLDRISFETEAETVDPLNITATEQAFRDFLGEMNWPLAQISFNELIDEKSGDYSMRDDGDTPSWYHEFSEVLIFIALVRSGKIPEDVLDSDGAEVMISSILRHDSWEDHGKTPSDIYKEFERDLYDHLRANNPDEEVIEGEALQEEYMTRNRASTVANVVDAMTRKVPVTKEEYEAQHGISLNPQPSRMDVFRSMASQVPVVATLFNLKQKPAYGFDDEGFVTKPNGKRLKVDRYDGDMNRYHKTQIQNPFAAMGKIIDSICGVDSRIMPDYLDRKDDDDAKFSTQSNIDYVSNRRAHFSGYPYAKEATKQHPKFAEAFKALDAILGIEVRSLEIVNHYFKKDNSDNPYIALPLDIDEWAEPAREVLEVLPNGWRPDILFLERLENIAQQELERSDGKQSTALAVLNHALYPAYAPLIGEDRRTEDVLAYEENRPLAGGQEL